MTRFFQMATTISAKDSAVTEASFSKDTEVVNKRFRDIVTLDQEGFERRNAKILRDQKEYTKEKEKVQTIKQSQAVFNEFRSKTLAIEANILLGEEEVLKRDQMAFVMGQGQWAISNLAAMHVIIVLDRKSKSKSANWFRKIRSRLVQKESKARKTPETISERQRDVI